MAIIKTKIKEKNYMQIDKTGIQDSRLSWSATGLLTYLIGRPDDWEIIIEHLRTVKTNGRDSTKSALVELRQYEYCHYFELREKGIIRETFYLVFEVPTPYGEAMKECIEIPEGYTLLYKPVSKKIKNLPSNEISIEPATEIKNKTSETNNTLKTNIYPETAFPLTANRSLIIKDDNKIDINDQVHEKKVLDEKEADLDFFENLFKEFKINFTKTNQEAVKKLLLSLSSKQVEEYLRETYTNIQATSGVKDPARLFSSKIAKGERQVIPKAAMKKIMPCYLDQETENKEIFIKQEKVLKTELNYLLGYVENNFKTSEEAYQDLIKYIKNKEFNNILIEKYKVIAEEKLKIE